MTPARILDDAIVWVSAALVFVIAAGVAGAASYFVASLIGAPT